VYQVARRPLSEPDHRDNALMFTIASGTVGYQG